MDQFPPNSRKAAETQREPKKIDRVTSAETRPKGLGRKFKDTFIGGDARTAADYVAFHVVVPAVRDLLFDALESGFRSMIYGENRPRRGGGAPQSSGYSNPPKVDYSTISVGPVGARTSKTTPSSLSRSSRARLEFDELVIPDRQSAEEVLEIMYDILSRYGSVSVADLYELTGLQSQHTDMKWGWTGLRGAKAVRLRQGGFLLDLPAPQALN